MCLPPEKKADIIDFIMQRRLEEIDLDSTDTSDRLIALRCGHVFTVETLDGHCGMSDYYDINHMGQFTSTKSPPTNYQKPPTCPTCRGPITALRYGRVTKRATLDILEQNVASTMSTSLAEYSPAIAEFASNINAYKEQAKELQIEIDEGSTVPATAAISFTENGPISARMFDAEGMQKAHGFALREARGWYNIVKELIITYRRVAKIATTRGAHVKAYEAALATLFRLEMLALAVNTTITHSSDTPLEPLALVSVDRTIGQPPPKADVRFQIEAYFLTLELRVLIAQVAQARTDALSVTTNTEEGRNHRARWEAFVMFLYNSCIADARKAQTLADRSSATRQAVRASVHVLRFEFETIRTQTMRKRLEMFRAGRLDAQGRSVLASHVKAHKLKMVKTCKDLEKEYIRKRPSATMEDLKSERKWLEENCGRKINAWSKECDALEDFLLKDGFYQPMSLQEQEEIVKAFNFCEYMIRSWP